MKKLFMIAIALMVFHSCDDERDNVVQEKGEIQPGNGQPKLPATLQDATAYVYSSTDSRYEGKIDGNNKVKVSIPYSGGSGNYREIRVVGKTPDGVDTNVFLVIAEGSFTNLEGNLEGHIEVENKGEYVVKQLEGGQEEVIVTFNIPTNSGESKVELKAMGVILDKCFGKTTNDCWSMSGASNEMEHQFVYLPVKVGNQTWLSHNLGAEYSRVGSDDFNPLQQGTSADDWKAYGSLFQWQRRSDGHELINWTGSTKEQGTPKHGVETTLSDNWTPTHNKFIKGGSLNNYSWVEKSVNVDTSNKDLWKKDGSNNPCPTGYHVPTYQELETLHSAITSSGKKIWDNTTLRLPASGRRHFSDVSLDYQGSDGGLWSSEKYNEYSSWFLSFDGSESLLLNYYRAHGFGVRCLKN